MLLNVVLRLWGPKSMDRISMELLGKVNTEWSLDDDEK
jgi:hypothetical protein